MHAALGGLYPVVRVFPPYGRGIPEPTPLIETKYEQHIYLIDPSLKVRGNGVGWRCHPQ